jgi:hypothetical protein
MRVVEIRYTRKFNLKNYENEDIGIVAQVDEGENVQEAFNTLKETAKFLRSAEVEPAKAAEPTKAPTSSAASKAFSLDEFLNHQWMGKKLADGSYAKGTRNWGWDYAYQDREGTLPNFSEESLKMLQNGPIDLGDGYEAALDESQTFVHMSKPKKRR